MKVKHGEHSGSPVTSPLLDFRLEENFGRDTSQSFALRTCCVTMMTGAEGIPGFASF